MIPVIPEEGVVNGLHNIIDRVVEPLRKRRDLEILAIVPNRLSQRIDHQNEDRMLLEALCRNETFADYVPDFAYLAPETWDAIDAGDVSPLPKPGIREDADINKALRAHETLATYNPANEQLACFDELASIIETGGVSRDD
jgi:chromosome partitioning protein